jgi:tetratricopeptide (TPR) repeat protein
MQVATYRDMFCRGRRYSLHRRSVAFVVGVLFLAAAARLAAEPTPLADSTELTATPSKVWLPAFTAYVDLRLSAEQLKEAQHGPRAPNADDGVKLLDQLVRERAVALQDPFGLPPYAIPPVYARGISGATLEIARLYMEGEVKKALRRLERPDLRKNPMAAHVRAQLLDEQEREAHPSVRLDVIDAYRAALRLGPNEGAAQRARLRIGQIYLEIGFLPEARSELGVLRQAEVEPELQDRLRISVAEAAFNAGDVDEALAELESLELGHLPRDARRWGHQRRGDVLLSLHRFPPAADEYRIAYNLHDEEEPPSDALRVRFALAELESRKSAGAEGTLESIPEGPSPESAIAGLLRSRARRESGDLEGSVREALGALKAGPEAELAALAGVAALEGERLRGRTSTAIPPGAAKLLNHGSRIPGVGLLAYEIAKLPLPNEESSAVRRRIAEVLVTLPEGAVRSLVRRDLSHRIGAHLAEFLFQGEDLDSAFVEDLERYLHPRRVPEDLVLLALETFFRTRERSRCANWARALQTREVRPIRRGLALWREVQCATGPLPEPDPQSTLVRVAQSGEAGAFSLPLIALIAEGRLRLGEVDRAELLYSRALESFRPPELAGPVLIRLGETRVAAGRNADATRPILEGLALLEPDVTVTRPFRSVGLVTLLRLAEAETPTSATRVSIQQALQTTSPQWSGALHYLASRVKLSEPPRGDGLFARATAQMRAADLFSARLRREHPPSGSSAKRGAHP